MPLLELRLEDWQVVDEAGGRAVWAPRFDPDAQPLQLEKLLLLRAGLEFFDRALVSGMAALSDREEFLPVRVFSGAAELTLLRFGVRIAGLESEPDA